MGRDRRPPPDRMSDHSYEPPTLADTIDVDRTAASLQSTIATWIQRACLGTNGFGERGGGFILRIRDMEHGRNEIIGEYPINVANADPLVLAQSIYLDACGEAEGIGGGTHTFLIQAQRSGEKNHFARRSFLVRIDLGADAPIDEEATAKGLLAQSYRHQEATQRIHAQAMPALIHGYTSIIQSQSDRLSRAEANMTEMMATWKELILAKDEREAEMHLRIARENRIDRAMELAVKYLVPHLVPKLLSAISPDDVGTFLGFLKNLQAGQTPQPVEENGIAKRPANGVS